MYLLQVSLFLGFSLYVHTSNIHNPKLWHNQAQGARSGPSTDQKNCFCYPEGHLPTIHEILDPKNKGQERLVIYLYKNSGSNEIKMYTPNIEKQMLIPDLPYEAGDDLVTVFTETIATIFNNNPNIVKIINNRFETANPSVKDNWPIGLNIGEVEIIYPNGENSLTPYNDHKGNNYAVDVVPQAEPLKKLSGIAIPNKWHSQGEYNSNNPEIIEQFWWSNKIKYPFIPSGNFNPNTVGLNDLPFSFHINGAATSFPSGSSTQDINNPIFNQYMTFTVWFNQQIKRFQNIQLPNDIKVLEHNSLRILVQQILAENGIQVSGDGVLTYSNGVVIDAANLELRPILLGEKIEQLIFQKSFSKFTLPKNLLYLEGILVIIVNPPQVLGIIPLGKTYLSQFSFPGNSVNGTNTYFNDYGNANSASSYSSIVSSKGPLTLTIKEVYSGADRMKGSPYLYSGGRPISPNKYSNLHSKPLSSSYSYLSTNEIPHSETTKVSYWSSEPYSTVSKEPTKWTSLPNTHFFGKRRKVLDAKIEHHYEPLKSRTTKKKGRINEKSKTYTDINVDESKENNTPKPLTSESGRRLQRPSLKNVMKTLLYILDDAPSRAGSGPGENSTETDDIVNGAESLNGGDQPDFRIIGGNAATGSGTPLSNKGRSGYYAYN